MNQETASQLHQLFHAEWENRLREDPIFATYTGDHRYNDRLPGMTEGDFERRLNQLRQFRQQLGTIDPEALSPEDRLNYSLFACYLDNEIGELSFHSYRLPISKSGGFHQDFPELPQLFLPLNNYQDYQNFLARLVAFYPFVNDFIQLMREASRQGYRPARVTLDGVENQLRAHITEQPENHRLFEPFTRIPELLSAQEQQSLKAEGRKVIQSCVVPAFQALLRFLLEEYLPAAREGISASELPDGEAFYRHRIRYETSLDLSPQEIHQIGIQEVDRIRAEMQAVIQKVGFKGDFPAFLEFLRTDPRFYAPTPEALLKETAYILKRMDGELPRLFGCLPRTPYGIRPVPQAIAPDSTTAFYFPPPGDRTSAGFYYVNTYDLPSRPLYEIEALSLHEAVPGHHLQLALQQELEGLPNFRRFVSFTAYIEGWALYAERLGLEVGFYQDPYSDFGRLSYEMWRACRLVVDTGMHALGWSRQQAIDFMAQNTSSTLLNITNEIDRYIAWPAQALAYKLGELKIRELRARAEKALGSRFDRRAFHDLLLESGPIPLNILERRTLDWIEKEKS